LEKQGKLTIVKPAPRFPFRFLSRRTCLLRSRRAIAAIAMIASWSSFELASAQQKARPEEYQVKAAYLFNFGKFTKWPATSAPTGEPFAICVLGRDPFGAALDATISGESIDGRKLIVRRLSGLREITAACPILFVGASEKSRIKEILAAAQSSGSLTVSDIPEFTSSGGMIQFVIKENKVRFEVNLPPAQKAGLEFSSQLLKVAVRITGNEREGNTVQ
jgi:hypothetical protein